MELSVESFNRICRGCLRESIDMKSLFTKLENRDQRLVDLYNSAVNMSVRAEDGLPNQVCGDCERVIYQIEEFRHRCLRSDTVLKKVFESSTQESVFESDNADTESKEVKNESFLHKLSDFDLQVVDKKDLVELTQSFGSEVGFNKIEMLPVKKEIEYDNFADDFDGDALEVPVEYKEEKDSSIKSHAKLSCRKHKKLQWKVKKIQKKDNAYKGVTVNMFSCLNCNIHFENISDCQKHHATQHGISRVQTKSDNEDKTEERLQCSLCFRRCKTKKTLSKHMKLHEQTDNIKYSCEKCKREFKYKSFLDSHIISVHMHNNFTCQLCTEMFSDKISLEAHIDSHKEKKKHICNVCKKAFIMSCTLKDHMRKHTGEKPFLCSTCGKGFSQKTNLAQHQRRHLGLKPFKCNICTKSFVSKGELDAHTRKHSGAHPFVCDDCGNGFTTSSALVKHRRTHTGERPYACDLCPMRFAASGTLTNHRRTHTGERPFQCSHCEKAFVQRTDMISHVRCHTGERPYVCTHCGQSFRKHATMKTHLKMHGKESVVHAPNVMLMHSEQINS